MFHRKHGDFDFCISALRTLASMSGGQGLSDGLDEVTRTRCPSTPVYHFSRTYEDQSAAEQRSAPYGQREKVTCRLLFSFCMLIYL